MNNKNIFLYSLLGILVVLVLVMGAGSFISYKLLVRTIYAEQQQINGLQQTLNDLTNLPDNNSQMASYYPGKIVKDVQPTANAAIIGNPQAKVTVIEFADFQCPFCKKFFDESEDAIIKKYVDSGQARFVFENFPFLGNESQSAAEAAKCAQDQKQFWPYHDYLYNHQGPENSGTFTDKNLESFAAQIKGINTVQFKACLESHKELQSVSDEYQLGTKSNVTSTPTIFIDGREVVGAYSTQTYENIIDEELKK